MFVPYCNGLSLVLVYIVMYNGLASSSLVATSYPPYMWYGNIILLAGAPASGGLTCYGASYARHAVEHQLLMHGVPN